GVRVQTAGVGEGPVQGHAGPLVDRPVRSGADVLRRHVVDVDGGRVIREAAVLVEDAGRHGVVAGAVREGEGRRGGGAAGGVGRAGQRGAVHREGVVEPGGRVRRGGVEGAGQRHAEGAALVHGRGGDEGGGGAHVAYGHHDRGAAARSVVVLHRDGHGVGAVVRVEVAQAER